MRLTVKITLAVLLGVALIFSIYSYFSIQREREQLKKSLSREARHLGESLRVMVTEIWHQQGEREAIAFLARANQVHGEMLVRWVWVEKNATEKFQPRVPIEQLEDLREEETLALLAASEDGRDFLLTYLPLLIDGGKRVGAIELSESMDELHDYVEESLRRSAMVVGAMVVTSLLLVGVLGSFWVGRPMRHLHAQAERIGTGDFSTSLNLTGSDELTDLGNTIERMRTQLAEARKAEEAATREKFETLEKLRHTERLATLGKLSAGMAHELGTPLNVISGRAKLIGTAELPAEDIVRSAKIIGEQTERMTSIMRQLLSFARRGEARKQSVELNALLRSVLPLLEPSRKEKKVEVVLSEAEQELTVSADPGQLQQVLLNLALNGIQSMDDGGRLELQAGKERRVKPPKNLNLSAKEWCSLQVRDQGSGISKENMSHIFDPFFTTKEVGQGTGLGLSIAYGIIEEHGGWIDVDSQLGQGSRFIVYLPLDNSGVKA